MAERFPATFPSGQGADFAGEISETGPGIAGTAVGDAVVGWSDERSSQAEYVVVPGDHIVPKPAEVPWEAAGALFVAGTTSYAAARAVGASAGETVVVAAAAGGVGSILVQLLRARGVHVVGIASERNHPWLESVGAVPVAYGDGLADRVRAAAPRGIDAFVDLYGPDYVRLALELGVARDRIDTVISFEAAQQEGIKAEGMAAASTAEVLGELVGLVADGSITVPIARTYPLEQVREAYTELERHHTSGKIVLIP